MFLFSQEKEKFFVRQAREHKNILDRVAMFLVKWKVF